MSEKTEIVKVQTPNPTPQTEGDTSVKKKIPKPKKKDGSNKKQGSKKQEEPKIPAFQAGKFPVIFQTTTTGEDAIVERSFSIDGPETCRNHLSAFDVLRDQPEYEHYLADSVRARGHGQKGDMERKWIGTAFLTTAQNMVNTLAKNQKPISNLSYMMRTNITTVAAHFQIASQTGVVKDSDVGEWLIPTNPRWQAGKFVRAAWMMDHYPERPQDLDQDDLTTARSEFAARSTGWPLHHANLDPDFINKLRHHISEFFDEYRDEIRIEEEIQLFQNQDIPVWIHGFQAGSPEEDISNIFWGVNDPPDDWVEWLNDLPQEWWDRTSMQRPFNLDDPDGHRDFVAGDIPARNFKDDWEEITEKWFKYGKTIEKFFVVAGTASCSENGSLAQRSTFDDDHGIITFRSLHSLPSPVASLATGFPCRVLNPEFNWEQHNASLTGQVRIQEARVNWIKQFVK